MAPGPARGGLEGLAETGGILRQGGLRTVRRRYSSSKEPAKATCLKPSSMTTSRTLTTSS